MHPYTTVWSEGGCVCPPCVGVGGVPLPPPTPPMGSRHLPFPGLRVLPEAGQGGVAPLSDREYRSPPWTSPYLYQRGWVPARTHADTTVLVWCMLRGVCPYCGRLQTRSNLICCFPRSSQIVWYKGPSDGFVDPPCHIAAIARVPLQGRGLINQLDGFGGHPKGARGEFQFGGDRFQGLEGLKICVESAELRGEGESEQESCTFPEVSGMTTGWASK